MKNVTLDSDNGEKTYTTHMLLPASIRPQPPLWGIVIRDLAYAFGSINNLILILYIIVYKRYKTPIYAIILSLSASDLLMCTSALLWFTVSFPHQSGPGWFCTGNFALLFSGLNASSFHMAAISVLRFYQLVFPLSALVHVTRGLITRLCVSIWLLAIASGGLIGSKNSAFIIQENNHIKQVCRLITDSQIYDIWCPVVFTLMPFIITAIFHLAKTFGIKKIAEVGILSNNKKTKPIDAGQTVNRGVMVVIAVYLITAFPYIMNRIIHSAFSIPHNALYYVIRDITNNLLNSNSAINPTIYAMTSQSVRSDMWRMLSCKANHRAN